MAGPTITAQEIEEMYALREKGMSNYEIAQAMKRSKESVYRKIGRQPDATRCAYGSVVARVIDTDPPMPAMRPRQSVLKLVRTECLLEGALYSYKVEPGKSVELMTTTGANLIFTKEDFEIFVREIGEVLQMVSQ